VCVIYYYHPTCMLVMLRYVLCLSMFCIIIYYKLVIRGFLVNYFINHNHKFNLSICWCYLGNVYTHLTIHACLFDGQLPMQSVRITTDVLSSNLDQGEVYNIMWSSLSVTCDCFFLYFWPSFTWLEFPKCMWLKK
jgi:hypothetical protein